jgi:cytoskeleton protein RodZ
MTSIGETLRRERLRRNLELGQIADELKISSRFLEAIEREQFDKLPGGVFVKSFVRQYALLLGLDAEELSDQAQRLLEPPVENPPSGGRFTPQVPEIRVDKMEAWQAVGEHRSSWSSWITAGALVVAAMLVCSGAYWWWSERPRHQTLAREGQASPAQTAPAAPPAAPPPQPPANPPDTAAAASPDTGGVAPPVTEPVHAPATAMLPGGAADKTAQPPAALDKAGALSHPVHVEITANEGVWVRARADGKLLFEGTVEPGHSRSLDADSTVELRMGNAGGLTIALNGKPLSVEGFPAGTIGPKGQIRTVQLTSGGFQIVSPRPPDFLDRR